MSVTRVGLRVAEDRWDGRKAGRSAVEEVLAQKWPPFRRHGLPEGVAQSPILTPIVNHGRWLVQCPACPSATLASREDHRFFCAECGNELYDGMWLQVEWPENADQLEMVLGSRPDRRSRNWAPPFMLEDLITENLEHGIR